jgi:hypothetical protein
VPLHLHLPFAVAPCDARLTCGGGHLQGGPKESLLLKAAQMKRDTPAESAAVVMVREEAEIMKNIEAKKALMSAKELAKGVEYTQRMETGYVATRCTVVCPLTCGPAQAHITLRGCERRRFNPQSSTRRILLPPLVLSTRRAFDGSGRCWDFAADSRSGGNGAGRAGGSRQRRCAP